MSDHQQIEKIASVNWQLQPVQEVFPGIKVSSVWQGEAKGKAVVVTIEPGGTWQGVDVHETSSEEIFVVSGTFKDGDRHYEAGTFIHYPLGSSHVPQSDTGCVLFVFYPN
jgi:anti-sigma factor ChrR (cupin superfamily)